MPHFRSAVCQVCGVPGPPTEVPLTRAWNAYGSPVAGLMNASTHSPARPPGRRWCAPSCAGVVEHEEAATAETGRDGSIMPRLAL